VTPPGIVPGTLTTTLPPGSNSAQIVCNLHAGCVLQKCRKTLRICSTYCLSTATLVTRTLLNFTFIRTLPVFVILFCSLFRSARLLSPTVFSSQLHCYHLSRREPVHLTRSIAIRIPRLSIVFTFCYATSVSIFHHPFILTYFVHPIERDLIILIFGY